MISHGVVTSIPQADDPFFFKTNDGTMSHQLKEVFKNFTSSKVLKESVHPLSTQLNKNIVVCPEKWVPQPSVIGNPKISRCAFPLYWARTHTWWVHIFKGLCHVFKSYKHYQVAPQVHFIIQNLISRLNIKYVYVTCVLG